MLTYRNYMTILRRVHPYPGIRKQQIPRSLSGSGHIPKRVPFEMACNERVREKTRFVQFILQCMLETGYLCRLTEQITFLLKRGE